MRANKKILILSYYWPPSGGPGVQRWLKFVKYLPELGYQPIIITVDPQQATYPVTDTTLLDDVSGSAEVIHTSTREPFALYKKLGRKKQVPYSGFANEASDGFFGTLSRFIRGNLFVPDARTGWNHFAIKKAREIIASRKIEILITTSPPHSTQLTGLRLKKEFPHVRWIADLRDPWTDIFYYKKMLHLPMVKAWDRKMELQVLNSADVVVTVSHFVKEIFAGKLPPEQRSKCHVITNGFDHDDFAETEPGRDNDRFTISYVGTLADGYNLNGFLDAIASAGREENDLIRVHFTGSISPYWLSELKARLGEAFSNRGHTEHREALQEMKRADLLLLVIPEMEQNKGIVTGKIFEYMASGTPILGIGPTDGDAARILDETGTGKMFQYADQKGIAEYIRTHLSGNHPSEASPASIEQYSRKKLTEKLTNLF